MIHRKECLSMERAVERIFITLLSVILGFVLSGVFQGTEYSARQKLTVGLRRTAEGEELVQVTTTVKFKNGEVSYVEPFKEVR